ncbi:NAD(P)-dependent oxidoreductase [Komagataeibacter sp. FNDCF1]|uniref:NAD-dependent epimerase/dehydratase family protein n=1 Tax=Komagataeibacter sp. FNDCF1 TaxID=2878681 RepID=UPI001E29F965|nr:NAD(P)-dependent oxidoreductase [Komagataeibacter sp. FNDCF1]MCE2563311.1 NAD(P)-dependent oxidoreductase [Komagataeibacter sp. FNDCF1]
MSRFNHILVTGAAGALGRQLRTAGRELAPRIRLSDRVPSTDLQAHEEDFVADLGDFEAVRNAVKGCDAIIHLGGQAIEGPWADILNANIVGTYNVYEAARQCGVSRIIYASSIHAVGYYDRTQTIDASAPPRPDSLYGVSKAYAENLSRYYFDKFGIETVCLRIGSCFPKPADRRHLITWLSYDDFRQLVTACLDAPRVGHMISFATSANNQSFWDNRQASVLGYAPRDNAADFQSEVFGMTAQGDPNDPAVRFQGGSFCAAGHFDDTLKKG